MILCALALATAERLRSGPAGRDAVALREDPEAALALGVPVAARKAALLAIAGAFGAAAGAGFSLLIGVAAPADTSPLLALQLFAAVIVGAGAPVAGPLLAFAVIAGVPRVADALSETGFVRGGQRRGHGRRADRVPVAAPARGGAHAPRAARRRAADAATRGAILEPSTSPQGV